eukprot:Sdes_comp18363_c0_seq1m8140
MEDQPSTGQNNSENQTLEACQELNLRIVSLGRRENDRADFAGDAMENIRLEEQLCREEERCARVEDIYAQILKVSEEFQVEAESFYESREFLKTKLNQSEAALENLRMKLKPSHLPINNQN